MPFESPSTTPDHSTLVARRAHEKQLLDRESDELLVVFNQPFGESADFGSPEFESEAQSHWEQCKKACGDFFRPYQTGERLLSSMLENPETAVKMIEMMRRIYSMHKYIDRREWPEREQDMDNIANFLSWEAAASLESFDQALSRKDLSSTDLQRLKNNIFYIASEALDTHDEMNRRKLSAWLAKHKKDIFNLQEPDPSIYDDEESEVLGDETPFITKKNIIERAEEEILAIEVVRDVMTHGPTPDMYGDLESSLQLVSGIFHKCRPNDGALARRKEAVAVEAVRYYDGLGEDIVKRWKESSIFHHTETNEAGQKSNVYIESYAVNLSALEHLEMTRPGAARELFNEFGIANFGRYDESMLIRQLDTSGIDAPYGIVVYPEADWNGVFFQNHDVLKNAAQSLHEGDYEVRIVEAGSQRELARRLLQLHKRYAGGGNKFAFAIVSGHGTTDELVLGRNKALDQVPESDSFSPDPKHQQEWYMWSLLYRAKKGEFSKGDLSRGKGINRALREWFEPDAPKVLISCSTGVRGGVGEQLSQRSSGEVTAPKRDTNVQEIQVAFTEQGKPRFNVIYKRGETGIFVAGVDQGVPK